MFRWVRNVIVYILLWIHGDGRRRRQFLQTLIRQCKKRQLRKPVGGITEELDEVVELPQETVRDTAFTGCNTDGQLASFRITREGNSQEHLGVLLEIPGFGLFSYCDSRPLSFGSSKLRLEMLDPMRRWKVTFHGGMDRHVGSAITERLHVSVSLYWQCFADPFDHHTCPSRWQRAKNLSDLVWNSKSWENVFDREYVWYEQWGEMWGRVEIEGYPSQSVRLRGFRSRQFGDPLVTMKVSQHVIQDGGGFFIMNGYAHSQTTNARECFGYTTTSVGERWATDQSDLRVKRGETSLSGSSIQFPFNIHGYEIPLTIDKTAERELTSRIRLDTGPFSTVVNFGTYTINGKKAHGVHCQTMCSPLALWQKEREMPYVSPLIGMSPQDQQTAATKKQLTLPFQHDDCRCSSLVGGKGASLAVLTRLGFPVPPGFCITTHAFQLQVEASVVLQTSQECIYETIRKKAFVHLPNVCAEAVLQCSNLEVRPSLASAIEQELIQTFGKEYEDIYFAVRSSGVSEDGFESSYAGQLETFLCVKGLEHIIEAVRKCWASALSYQAVEYRRRNGQLPTEPIAVIVQEMVEADAAGVLFTNDPVTGNSSVLVINAALGLGDKVVAGTVNPDTINVSRNKGPDHLKVVSVSRGERPTQVDGSETTEDQTNGSKPCLSETQILALCRLALQIEESLGSPQDVEWAMSQDHMFILQTRPITTLALETDQELLHEFDTPLTVDDECVTRCNIGEVMPRALPVLTVDMFVEFLSRSRSASELSGYNTPLNTTKVMAFFTNKVFLNMNHYAVTSTGFLQDKDNLDISLTGRVIQDLTRDMIDIYIGRRKSFLTRLTHFITASCIYIPRQLALFKEWSGKVDSFTIGIDATNAQDLHNRLDETRGFILKMICTYAYKILESLIPYGILFKLLRGNSSVVSHANQEDIANLLSKCSNVVSADVPRSMQNLANAIRGSSLRKTFLRLENDKCHECILAAEDSVRHKYEDFLTLHGHRGLNEMDLFGKSWASDHTTLISALKLLVESPFETRLVKDTDGIEMNEFKTPISSLKKFIIRNILIERVKAGVAAREMGKSILIKTINILKVTYWRLADMMVRECRLPEEKLLFFLTHREIGILLETRSGTLIQKARRRMAILQLQDAISYPKMNFGFPEQISSEVNNKAFETIVCRGMPVSKGIAVGIARVVVSIDDADKIEPGDILICCFTDIGWSPYFPLLAGLVTEVGGLISHGAVIAREVGIPCIVNVTNATKIFKSGDRVRIDGLGGVVNKLRD